MKKRFLVFIPLLIALAIPAAIWATQTSPVSGGASVQAEDAAAMDYAMAIDPDMDMDEAKRRANLMEEARSILDSIREEAQEAPDTLAGFYLEHEPDLRVHLRLTAEPSSTLTSIIDKSPIPIMVSTDAPATLSETRRRLDRTFPAFTEP